ncbi:histidine kinase [Paenibacillus durus]|uniref:histidine kinase n=1 Tax=Paenibacillus durus TaxID=44251 RepID=A0A089HNR1_PAEDU|nr:histidine kinase [Paenibacillus durus]
MQTGYKAENDGWLAPRVSIIIWVILVYGATMFWQLSAASLMIGSLFFTVAILVHIVLHWHAGTVAAARPWLYFVIQGFLVYACAFLMPNGYPAALIGLFPVLIGQSIGIYYKRAKVIMISLYYFALFCIAVVHEGTPGELTVLIPVLVLMMVVVIAYAVLFFEQVNARIRAQTFLGELELAHRKVEELTLANERQRMARDLHDTLAQGLAGLIMRLEAVDAHLTAGNSDRARQIVGQSMIHARRALSDARQAIDNLRSKSGFVIDFTEAVHDEVRRFTDATGIHIHLDIDVKASLSRLLVEHSLHIMSEGLTNVARHAQANNVWVTVRVDSEHLVIKIRDDGKGFSTELIGRQSGHYGLIGIRERVRLIGGTIAIASNHQGTNIQIEAPAVKGDPL